MARGDQLDTGGSVRFHERNEAIPRRDAQVRARGPALGVVQDVSSGAQSTRGCDRMTQRIRRKLFWTSVPQNLDL